MSNDLLHPELMKGGHKEVQESQRYFRQGDIFYPKTSKWSSQSFKARPVMIASIMDDMEDDVIVAYEITSNYYVPSQVPILLDGKLSFIAPFREHMFSVNDFNKCLYYGSVNSKVLELIKYIKMKHLYGLFSEPHENFMKDYCENCLSMIEKDEVKLRRDKPSSINIRQIYLGGSYNEPVEDDKSGSDVELVYTDNQSMGTIGDLITPDIIQTIAVTKENEKAAIVEDIKEEKEEIEKTEKSRYSKPRKLKRLQEGYWNYDSEAKRRLRSNDSMSNRMKLLFLEDFAKFEGNLTKFSEKFSCSTQTIRNRSELYIKDLQKSGLTIPDDIMNVICKKPRKITPPPQNRVI